MPPVPVVRTIRSLRRTLGAWRDSDQRIGLVPTMGALHEGHLALARIARKRGTQVVVSIFVNPTQFAPSEDLSRYPRPFNEDRRKLAGLTDLIFAPDAAEMYPPEFATTVSLAGPAAVGLEDRFRPTHFSGVATVVAKLLIQSMPDIAVFGEKDFQQLKVVARMAADLALPVDIVAGPTVREPDGLALSSRNRYLTPAERAMAPALFATLRDCAAAIRTGADPNLSAARRREADGSRLCGRLRRSARCANAETGGPRRRQRAPASRRRAPRRNASHRQRARLIVRLGAFASDGIVNRSIILACRAFGRRTGVHFA
jgi:pantoate--beta-alanine ligase